MLAIALIVSVVANVCFAALVFRQAARAADALERSHVRTTEYTAGLVDRLMAVDYGSFMAHQRQKEARDTELKDAPPPPPIPTVGPDRGGFGSRLGLRALSIRDVEGSEAALMSDIPG